VYLITHSSIYFASRYSPLPTETLFTVSFHLLHFPLPGKLPPRRRSILVPSHNTSGHETPHSGISTSSPRLRSGGRGGKVGRSSSGSAVQRRSHGELSPRAERQTVQRYSQIRNSSKNTRQFCKGGSRENRQTIPQMLEVVSSAQRNQSVHLFSMNGDGDV